MSPKFGPIRLPSKSPSSVRCITCAHSMLIHSYLSIRLRVELGHITTDLDHTLKHIADMVARAVSQENKTQPIKSQLVVLPELCNFPYGHPDLSKRAETIGFDPHSSGDTSTFDPYTSSSPSVRAFAALARKHCIFLVAGQCHVFEHKQG